MKKLFVMFFILMLSFSLFACGNDDNSNDTSIPETSSDDMSVGLDYLDIVKLNPNVNLEEIGADRSGNKYMIYNLGSRENVILTEVKNPIYYNVKGTELSYSISEVTRKSIEEYLETSVSVYAETSVGVSVGIKGIVELSGELTTGLQETVTIGYNKVCETAKSMNSTAKVSLDKCELGKYYAWAITGNEEVYQCLKFDIYGNLVQNEIFSNVKSCELRIVSSENSGYEYSPDKKLSTLDPSIAKEKLKLELGEGTIENPYKINSATALHNIRYDMSANYELTSDIDLSEFGEWEPIGGCYASAAFTGTLDGKKNSTENYKIIGLTRTKDIPESKNRIYFGLFGWISSNGCVSNIDFENVNISIKGPANNNSSVSIFLGTVAGAINGNTQIKNITTGGNISYDCCTNGGAFVGGIIGNSSLNKLTANESASGFIISDCTNNCTVSSSRYAGYAGGIVGYSKLGTIKNCINNGNITSKGTAWWGYSYAGGIIGAMSSNGATRCKNTFNNGNIIASEYPLGPWCYRGTGETFGCQTDY